jgi:hypothetical protein
MAIGKSGKKQTVEQSRAAEGGGGSLWRKPISLDTFEDDDPLATLYRGRETSEMKNREEGEKPVAPPKIVQKAEVDADKKAPPPNNSSPTAAKKPVARQLKYIIENAGKKVSAEEKQGALTTPTRTALLSETELKNILKIKSASFNFTDIREILRGRSFDIYAYLRFLSGESGVCKIKHLDLMSKLDMSRPTLFKQAEWLTRLSLIERRNVPGDHLGTTYLVSRLEDVLPVPEALITQLESRIAECKLK